jgi:hypothetical protein
MALLGQAIGRLAEGRRVLPGLRPDLRTYLPELAACTPAHVIGPGVRPIVDGRRAALDHARGVGDRRFGS